MGRPLKNGLAPATPGGLPREIARKGLPKPREKPAKVEQNPVPLAPAEERRIPAISFNASSKQLRYEARMLSAELLHRVRAIARDPMALRDEILKATGLMLKYGVGERIEVQVTNRQVFEVVARVTADFLPMDRFEEWSGRVFSEIRQFVEAEN